VVFADQPADDPLALDPGGDIHLAVRLMQWRQLVERLVGPRAVVMQRVLTQDLPQMPLAEDQQVIETFAAKCSREPSGI
jgi:hypothetical protein